MMYVEFNARTGYVCGEKEFWGIVSEYNNSPLTKDEFCMRWKRMNHERIVANKCLQNRLAMAREAYVETRGKSEGEMERCRRLVEELNDKLYR